MPHKRSGKNRELPPARSYRARSGGQTLKSHVVGALPIIDHVLDRMQLPTIMDSYLPAPDPRSKVTLAQGLLVLLKNILLSREPIYGLGEWAEAHAPDLLGLCVYFLALLTQALIERELRRAMVDQRVDFLPLYPEGRPCKRPCTRRVLDLFRNIQRHELTEAGQDSNTMVTELSPIQREVLGLLGVPTRSYGRPTRA